MFTRGEGRGTRVAPVDDPMWFGTIIHRARLMLLLLGGRRGFDGTPHQGVSEFRTISIRKILDSLLRF